MAGKKKTEINSDKPVFVTFKRNTQVGNNIYSRDVEYEIEAGEFMTIKES